MNEISQALNLDITRRSNIQVIHLVQNDVASRKLVVKLTKDGVVQTITGTNLSAIINITRPDAKHASFSVTLADSTITAVIPTWAMEVAGQGLANFSILEGSTQKLSCENLVLDIQRSNNSSGDISQDDDTDILLELIAEVNDAVDRVDSIIETEGAYALEAEGHALGTQDGVPVGSSSPYYHNNSKYWAEQSAESAASVDVHVDGNYPEMTVGTAEALIGDLISENNATYLMRPTLVDAKRKSVKVTGATVAWNQLAGVADSSVSSNGISISFDVETGKTTAIVPENPTGYCQMVYNGRSTIEGHKYIIMSNKPFANGMEVYLGGINGVRGVFPSPRNQAVIDYARPSSNKLQFYVGQSTPAGTYEYYIQFSDLTLMFGSTIADALYAMEQAEAGSGIAFLKSYGFFTKSYYDYNAGALISVNPTAHKMTGFNQLDLASVYNSADVSYSNGTLTNKKTDTRAFFQGHIYGSKTGVSSPWNSLKVINITALSLGKHYVTFNTLDYRYIKIKHNGSSQDIWLSDAIDHFLPNMTYCFSFDLVSQNMSTVGGLVIKDINLNISWDGERDGEYEPYEEHTYALDSKTTENPSGDLRGLFKIVNGELVADGDEYTSDGKVTRKYGIVDMGTLDWTYITTDAPLFQTKLEDGKLIPVANVVSPIICAKYETYPSASSSGHSGKDKIVFIGFGGSCYLRIQDSAYTDAATFKAAMNGQYLVYELATPTEEEATPYADPMISLKDGTEEWDSPIPVYTEADYFDAVTSEDIRQAQSEMMAELTEKIYNTLPTDKIENAPIASFPDGADGIPVKSATFAIQPVQDLHGYDAPWPAGGGKNLVFAEDKSGITAQTYITEVFSLPTGTYTMSADLADANQVGVALRLIKNGTASTRTPYSATTSPSRESETFTVNDTDILRLVVVGAAAGYNGSVSKVQVEAGSTATSFAPYSNICPITGFTGAEITAKGVNLWDEEWEVGAYNSATGAKVASNDRIRSKNYIPVIPLATYYVGKQLQIYFYDSDKNFIDWITRQNGTFVAPSDVYYITFNCAANSGTTYNNDISINYPSTDTAYHASVGTTHDITWQDDAGTVYGGTLQYLGGDAWRLTATNGVDIYDGTESWTVSGGNQGFYHQNDTTKRLLDYTGSILCDRLKTYPRNGSGSYAIASFGITGYGDASYPNQNWIYAKAEGATTAAEFKTWLAANPITVVFPLATPVTYDLTGEELATVLGTNNVFSNTGDVTELTYRADTGLFVRKLLTN